MMKYLDWILSFSSCVMLWLMGNKNKYAPIIGICNQVLWIVYVVHTKHWGLLIGVLAYTFIHIRNAIIWWRESFADNWEKNWCDKDNYPL